MKRIAYFLFLLFCSFLELQLLIFLLLVSCLRLLLRQNERQEFLSACDSSSSSVEVHTSFPRESLVSLQLSRETVKKKEKLVSQIFFDSRNSLQIRLYCHLQEEVDSVTISVANEFVSQEKEQKKVKEQE